MCGGVEDGRRGGRGLGTIRIDGGLDCVEGIGDRVRGVGVAGARGGWIAGQVGRRGAGKAGVGAVAGMGSAAPCRMWVGGGADDWRKGGGCRRVVKCWRGVVWVGGVSRCGAGRRRGNAGW